MECPKCKSSKVGLHDRNANLKQERVKCRDCGKTWLVPKGTVDTKPYTPKIGMSLDQFRAKHDIDFIVDKALKTLQKDVIYEKPDLYKLCGLAASTQGLSAALEAQSKYYGKTGGKPYYSHPDTISMLKEQAKLN